MKKFLLPLLTFTLVHCNLAAEKVDETKEPQTTFSLLINGKAHELKTGKEMILKGVFKDPTVKIVPNKIKHFTYGGIAFNYPAHFSFEADISDEVSIWSLDGNDMVLMYYIMHDQQLSAKEVAQSIAGEFEKGAAITTAEKVTFNGITYNAFRVNIKIASAKLSQLVLTLPSKKGTRALVIQDLAKEDKVNENEANFALKLLNESLKIK